MKHVRYIAIFLYIFSQGITLGYAQDDWIKFKVDGDLPFSVEVPGDMEKSIKTIKTAVGELNVVSYAYQGEKDDQNYLYLINFVNYPDGTFPSDSINLIDEFLTNAVESSVDRVKGELLYSSTIDDGSGKLFRIKYNEGQAIIKGKSYIRNDAFISLQVFTIESKSLNDEMDIFLNSFRARF